MMENRGRSRRSERFDHIEESEFFERETRRHRDSRRRKKAGGRLVTLVVLLAVLAAAAILIIGKLREKYAPSRVQKDLNEWFEVSGTQARIYLNDAAVTEFTGVSEDGELYLPLDWSRKELNKRLFWSPQDEELTMTLPDEILHYDRSSRAPSGAPLLKTFDGTEYIALSFVREYSDITAEDYSGSEYGAKRALIYLGGFERSLAMSQKECVLRTRGDIKADMLVTVPEGTEITVLDEYELWSRVVGPEGIRGYLKNEDLTGTYTDRIPGTYQLPVPQRRERDGKIVMGWNQISNLSGNNYFESYYETTGGAINVISPTWLQICDAEGNLEDFSSETYVRKAHEAGLEVWPTVDNFNQPGGLRDFSTRDFFRLRANRERFIESLLEKAETYGYDGLNLDFEGLPSDAGESFAEFFRELSVLCRRQGLTLSIDNYVPYSFNDFMDITEQGAYVDYIVIMGYDEHTQGSPEPGSTASLGYTSYGIREACQKAAPGRVINGIPFYSRLWKEHGGEHSSEVVTMKEMTELMKNEPAQISWDDKSGQYYYEKKTSEGTYKCWIEETRSVREKMKLIRHYDLAGVAVWRLGYEPAEVWDEITFDEKE